MKTKNAPRDASWDDYLVESLKDPAEAAGYLETVLEDGDPAAFLIALRQVAQARGMSAVARKAKVGRESLYKTLSGKSKPEMHTLMKLLPALGLRLSVTAA